MKLALIGKDIQHSRSPEIYRKLLKDNIQYDLLDYENHSLIPSAAELLDVYDGISITSPYKKHFINQVQLTSHAQILGAINCLKKNLVGFTGENTDYLAIIDILEKLKKEYQSLAVVVLGDGVMSMVVQVALKDIGIEYKVFSRKKTESLSRLNVVKIFAEEFKEAAQSIVINTCSREFIFHGSIDSSIIFWDFNYSFASHVNILTPQCQIYMDGMNMLELQARYALSFWSTTS